MPGDYYSSHGSCCSRFVVGAAASSSSDYSLSATTSPSPSTSTSSSSSPSAPVPSASLPTIVFGVALVVATGVVNRLLYKASIDACGPRLALFLALLQASAPAIIYSLILELRVKAGLTTQEELDAPDTLPLLAVGAGEASSSVLGFLVASRLPGAALPMLAQSMLVWQMGFERLFLRKRQTRRKLVGAAMVVIGVCLAAWPASGNAAVLVKGAAKAASASASTSAIPLGAALTYIFAQSFPAAAALAKERIFSQAAEKLNRSEISGGSSGSRCASGGGNGAARAAAPLPKPTTTPKPRKRKQLDTFVVSARASVAQAAVVAALLPLSALLGPAKISPGELPRYLVDGARAVAGLASSDGLVPPPRGFPWLPLSYVTANVLFNVALLRLLRAAGAFVYSAGAALLVPAAIVAFSIRWPFSFLSSSSSSSLGPHFALGAVVLVAGLGVVVASTSSSSSSSSSAQGGESAAVASAATVASAAAAAAATKSKNDGDDASGDDDEQKYILSPPLLGDVGLEAA